MLGQLERVAAEYPFLTGLSASVLAGAGATALGAVPIAFISRLSEGVTNLLLSFAAGIMLAATMFSLLLPGLDNAVTSLGAVKGALLVIASLATGGLTLWLAHRYAPHEHFCKGCEGGETRRFTRIWLFISGAIGAFTVAVSSALLPCALGFAGGAMLFVISSEVIPETHRPGFERGATAALFTGFSVMFFLSAVLG